MKNKFAWRHQYDDDADEKERSRTDIDFSNEISMTQQHFTEEVDLNVMMKRMGVTDGAIPPAAVDPRYFGDFSDATDLRTTIDRVREAEHRFGELPADIRRRFNNDPAELYGFITKEENLDEAVTLGLLHKAVAEVRQGVASSATPAAAEPPK